MKMFRQIIYDFRSQPVIGVLSVIGTALAILLVMVATIVYEVDYAPIAPESNRDRLLYDCGMYMRTERGSGCSSLSLHAIDRLYRPLVTAERVSAISRFFEPVDVSVGNDAPFIVDSRKADAEVWHIFDHEFVSGTPFTDEDVKAGRNVAVIDESTARRLFKTYDAAGRAFMITNRPYTVKGVIRDVSPLMKWSYAQLWLPAESDYPTMVDFQHNELFGDYGVVLMASSPDDVPAMREEALRLNNALNRELAASGCNRIDCGAPYGQLELSLVHGSNNPPATDQYYLMKYILFVIFLIVPAINLSGMTQSRLRSRRHEIGVRRAFGATRLGLLLSLLRENLLVTLLGGMIGLVLSIVFVSLLADLLFEVDTWQGVSSPLVVTWGMLFRWATFGWALLFCFVLNLLSAGRPAWRASRINPVEAINQIND